MNKCNMKPKQGLNLLSAILIVVFNSIVPILCNPIPYEPTLAPLMGVPPMPIPAPMMMGPQFDLFASMQAPTQYILAPPFGPMPLDSNRRSVAGMFKPTDKSPNKPSNELSDDQKAMGDLPVSFLEPEAPSTITERLSDSFSALGEGVRNHFRSLSENFSDTMDDIKDAWRSSENSRKRG